ncbi:MAG TPA: S24 family peptidase [Terriglobales bacterium]|nr:S24 family peptidase [Terriglobales bacterium]
MHPIQRKLLELSAAKNLAQMSLREMAAGIGVPTESPQRIKHHLQQLQKKGLLTIDRTAGIMSRTGTKAAVSKGLVRGSATLLSIPIVGAANCGPATLFAEQNFEGVLRVSARLVGRTKPNGLFALKADGSSMNRATIGGRTIDDGDYVVIDSRDRTVRTNDVVVAILDGKATIKRFVDDRENGQIVLKADSSFDYEPIHLHPDDDFTINGKAIAIIKRTRK